ncbi:MAG: DUF819 family protein [Bacteroidia bacterium]|nr:DUF819 family protein [Bacteroidia bacterium]
MYSTVSQVFYILCWIFSPYFIQKACKRWVYLDAVGPVVLCYTAGFMLSQIFQASTDLAQRISEVALSLGMPCLLFSVSVRRWFMESRRFLVGYALAVVAVCASAIITCIVIFPNYIDNAEMAGMLVGDYTGGTPNLIAIGKALQVPETLLVNMNTVDVLIGGGYFLLLLGPLPKVLKKIFEFRGKTMFNQETNQILDNNVIQNPSWKHYVLGIILAAIGAGITLGASELIYGSLNPVFVILGITSVAIAFSLIPAIHKLPGTHIAGEYLILMFCVGMGGMVSLEQMGNMGGEVAQFMGSVLLLSIIFHYISCWIVGIDSDVTIVTNVAAIFNPAFVPPVVQAIKKPEMLFSGIAMGLLGFAIGNYLGITLSLWLRSILSNG